jgi:hypothetical protein
MYTIFLDLKMSRLKAFISYSVKQKVIGGRFKYCLENYCGYEVFVAHSDMPAASVFREEILTEIKKSDFFIPLVSEHFKLSDYSDQETGAAVISEKKIIPVKLEHLNPYGLINHIQAIPYKESSGDDNVKELVLTIAQIGLRVEQYHAKAIDSLIYAFYNSGSFISTNATIEIMVKYNQYTKVQLDLIVKTIKTNVNVQGAYGLAKLKAFLRDKYNISID